MPGRQYLTELWKRSCGLSSREIRTMPSIEELRRSEWSDEFEKLMRNRLVMGAFRYGRMHEKDKPHYNRIQNMQKRLEIYAETGNLECLVDVANLALMEFEEGNHPKRHFKSVDDKNHTPER